MAREEIQKQWEARIAAFRASGEKATHWCNANHVNRRQLYNWMKRMNASLPTPVKAPWVNVEVVPDTESKQPRGLTIRIGAALIDVHPGFNPALLRDVVKVLAP
jgi:hypothetical protein